MCIYIEIQLIDLNSIPPIEDIAYVTSHASSFRNNLDEQKSTRQ